MGGGGGGEMCRIGGDRNKLSWAIPFSEDTLLLRKSNYVLGGILVTSSFTGHSTCSLHKFSGQGQTDYVASDVRAHQLSLLWFTVYAQLHYIVAVACIATLLL